MSSSHSPQGTENPKKKRPNVLVILADDMGYGDLSAYGSQLVETVHIDSIGRDGVRFTDGYSSAPLCSPSRAGLVTGRYQQRFGFEQQVSSGAWPERREVREDDGSLAPLQGEAEFLRRGIPLSEKNVGELFHSAGYRTAVIGKWHLGHGPDFLPHRRGFDHSVVFYGNTSLQSTKPDDPDMVSLKVDFHDETADTAWTREGLNEIRHNGEIVKVDQYLMFYFRDQVVDFIGRQKDSEQPFFLYFAMNSPVPPLQVPKSYFEALRSSIPNIAQRGYNALLKAQDDAVGAVLNALKTCGLEEDTLVVFVSDNGTALSRPGSNAPFSGGKYSTMEGGIRMPYMMKWPGQIPAGMLFSKPVSTLDILPTAAAACGVSTAAAKPLDGVNLLPYLRGESAGEPHEALYWKLAAYSAVRVGKWKLYLEPRNGVARLFDLEADPAERHDLSAAEPQIFAELNARYTAWESSLPPRAWTNISPTFKK
ncbi:sulfatase-like hydrolase/transferase [Hydrogenophaga pseudoflava]|uniref:sulfatase-like hydrolase/transferase n=1 Tax=Hydrogenophaga pseudoflava TaxID=47421 RepID=UPI0027E4C9A3|nr:sulfatase-like hydrolase/transferase [Hydrogenophaga pseudoflava]MDQ7744151.1 sulfatase-like hydrolase/transferase [Hydrogenophaga pseudoflava]